VAVIIIGVALMTLTSPAIRSPKVVSTLSGWKIAVAKPEGLSMLVKESQSQSVYLAIVRRK
jgi:hypothetical protein